MKAVFRLGKLAHPFIELLSLHPIVSAATSMGTDKRFFFPLLEVNMSSIGPLFHSFARTFADRAYHRLRELVDKNDCGFQRGAQKAYKAALDSTLANLKKRSLLEHQEISPATIEAFFEDLKVDYRQQEPLEYTGSKDIIDAFAFTEEVDFEKVREALQLDLSLPETEILRSVVHRFPEEMEQAFLEQLLNPEHERANLDFVFYLVESYLHLESEKQKVVLREASSLLDWIVAFHCRAVPPGRGTMPLGASE